MTTEPKAKAGWSVPRESRTLVTADGVEIAATVRGEGPVTVVVAHGFSGGHRHGSHAKILGWFEKHFQVIAIDQRGHGKSGGGCTLGHYEVHDIDAAVKWARELGAANVVTVGFSMGSSGVLRQAALAKSQTQRSEFDRDLVVKEIPDAVVSIGGPAQWWYRGSTKMKIMHVGVATTWGRWLIRERLGVRLSTNTWPDEHAPNRYEVQPIDPADSAGAWSPNPLLVVHGMADDYFPTEHAHRIVNSTGPAESTTLWLREDMLHAESGTTQPLVDDICQWIKQTVLAK